MITMNIIPVETITIRLYMKYFSSPIKINLLDFALILWASTTGSWMVLSSFWDSSFYFFIIIKFIINWLCFSFCLSERFSLVLRFFYEGRNSTDLYTVRFWRIYPNPLSACWSIPRSHHRSKGLYIQARVLSF